MNILVNVINQKLKIKANTKRLVSGTQNFIRFEFSLDDAWDNLLVFAQFIQNGKAYNDYLDENNSVYLPPEIIEGKFNVLLYGSGSNVIATTNYLTFEVDKNMLISDAQSTEITESLYNKLVNIVKTYASQSASGAPTLASSSSLMTDPKTIYLYTGSEDNYIKGDWYYFLGGRLQHGGTYGAGVVDSVPRQDSPNAVSSGAVWQLNEQLIDELSRTYTEPYTTTFNINSGGITTSGASYDDHPERARTQYISVEAGKTYLVHLNTASYVFAQSWLYSTNIYTSATRGINLLDDQNLIFTAKESENYFRCSFKNASDDTQEITEENRTTIHNALQFYTLAKEKIDELPIKNSTNAVSSGAVWQLNQQLIDELGRTYTKPYTSTFSVISGGITTSGANYDNHPNRARTQYISVEVGKTYFVHLNTTGYAFAQSWLYSTNAQTGAIRGINLLDDQNLVFTAKGNESYFRCSFKNASDATQEITEENRTTIHDTLQFYTMAEVEIDVADGLLYAMRIPLLPCQFIGNAYTNSAGTVSDNEHCVTTIRLLTFNRPGKIKVYTTNSNLYFSYMTSADTALTRADESFIIDGNTELRLNILTVDNTPVKSSDLSDVYVMVSKDIYDQYIVDNCYKLLYTSRFNDYGTEIYRYGTYTTAEQLGFAKRYETKSRITSKPCISDKDVLIVCGHFSTNNKLEILAGTISETLTEGQWMTIPANTVFQVSFKSDSTATESTMSRASVYIVKGSTPTESITQYLSNYTITRADCAFLADDKLFMISRNNEQIYSVFADGAFVVSNESLDHDEGHANSCNYDNGYVYVSDWTDSTLIHVYSVDTENNALTYVRDLTIPVSDRGRIEYFVQNEEKEIFFIGWQNGSSSIEPNNLVYGLYVLTSDGYVLAWEKKALRPIVLQGFTVQDDNFYMVENDLSFNTTAIFRLDLYTGLMKKDVVTGSLGSTEGEAIIPIDNRAFFIVDKLGRLYFKSITV